MATQLSEKRNVATVRSMTEADVKEAKTIFHLAFGTFLGVPNPESFMTDRNFVETRWRSNPAGSLTAEFDGRVVGSNFVTQWGSFGFFGPLTVRPDLWDKGVAKSLLGPTVDLLDRLGVREAGLFTFAQSPKHIGLYQKFGFWPRFLTAITSKPVGEASKSGMRFSAMKESERSFALKACRELSDKIFEGLDLTQEINAIQAQQLGDTVLVWQGDTLDAFACCHCGEGTEAGADTCYVKFAAVRPGSGVERRFAALLQACESLAAEKGIHRMEAGVSLAREQAYKGLLGHGYRVEMQGVAMHRPNAPAYSREDVFVLDDWR